MGRHTNEINAGCPVESHLRISEQFLECGNEIDAFDHSVDADNDDADDDYDDDDNDDEGYIYPNLYPQAIAARPAQ